MNVFSHPPGGAHAPGNSADPESVETADCLERAASTPQAQDWLGRSARTLRKLMDRRDPPYRMIGHDCRIPIASLREILPEPVKPLCMRPGVQGLGVGHISRMGGG